MGSLLSLIIFLGLLNIGLVSRWDCLCYQFTSYNQNKKCLISDEYA